MEISDVIKTSDQNYQIRLYNSVPPRFLQPTSTLSSTHPHFSSSSGPFLTLVTTSALGTQTSASGISPEFDSGNGNT